MERFSYFLKIVKMETGVIPLLRMAVALPIVLLFVGDFPRTLSSPLVIDSVVCRTDHIVHSSFNSKELFSINGYIVDSDSFCRAIILHYESNCTIGDNLKSHCEWNRPSVGSLSELKGDSTVYNFDKKSKSEEEHGDESLLPPNRVTMAMPGFFALFCCLFCPCFRARRKETEHAVLVKESMHSESSVEMSSDKFPGSPARAPGSPLRVPASPLRVPPSPSRFGMSPKLSRLESVHLSLNQVAKATHNFSSALQIGEGGFGTVYKAQLQNGQFIAIKRAKKEHFETISTEFSSEVELLAKIDHRNLVKLLGYIDKGNERLIITEYVPNGTLREHLDGERGRPLDFNQRLEISIDIAHALTYLHLYAEKTIIHRDVKSSNILLTESYRAKVADFGFAKLGPADNEKTHISTKVKGTIGYLDPEYMRTYQLTPKSDVYSFGVLLLEILTGRRPVELKRPADERVTLIWAFKKYNARDVVTMVDPTMEVVDDGILIKMFGLAIQCAAPVRADRPDMKSVGEQLWAIRMNYLKRVRKG